MTWIPALWQLLQLKLKERFTLGFSSLANMKSVRSVGHINRMRRDKTKSRSVTLMRKWQGRAARESAARMWLLVQLMNVALASVIYYTQADDFFILPDAGLGRAGFWVPGHVWGFQTATVCKGHAGRCVGPNRWVLCLVLFHHWEGLAGLWIQFGLGACISILFAVCWAPT